MVETRKILLLSLYSLQFAVVESAKFKNYCSPKVCNKCRSYLVRNYGDRSDRLWLMCSALARNEECCSFVSGPTLFTEVSQVNLEAACSNQPQNYTILSGKREIEIENCDLEESNEDLKSFLQDEAGLGNSEISKICADSCTDPETCSSCFDVNEKMNEIEFWHQEHPQQSLFDPQSNKCAIVQNEFQSCAAVYNVKRQEDIKTGLSYALGAVFIGVLIALTALLMKYKKRDDERLSKNLNRRKSQAQDEKQILKSYQNEQEP